MSCDLFYLSDLLVPNCISGNARIRMQTTLLAATAEKAAPSKEEKAMSQVRAKFKVNRITRSPGWNGNKEVQTIELSPVTSGSEENAKFYAATPGGSINLTTVNFEAAQNFDLGDEFYIDFTKAA